MAAKKKKSKTTRRRASRRPVRVRHKKDQAIPLGFVAGGLIGGGHAISSTDAGGAYGGTSAITWAKDKSQTGAKRAEFALRSAYANALESGSYVPAVVGLGVSVIGPKVPIVGKPLNRMIRKVSKGKVSL